jgi:hypothetical protein
MLVYVECINESGQIGTIAFNPTKIVSIQEVKSESLYFNVIIRTSDGNRYHSKENFLELVGRFNSSL